MTEPKKENILLMGNPNVGKSAIFSRLTGAKVIVSNYPGTTVEYIQGTLRLGERKSTIIDVPGTYSIDATSKAEEVAVNLIKHGDIIINVVNSTNLERNLYLTMQLLEQKKPLIVVLNMWDETKHNGIEIDPKKLEELLGVPVVPTCGLTGEGIKDLITRLDQAKTPASEIMSDEQRWEKIGKIVEESQKLTHHHHTFLEVLEEASIKPFSGFLIAILAVYVSFLTVRFIGEGLITHILEPIFNNLWMPLINKLSVILGAESFIHNVLIGEIINGKIDFGTSFGVLTTGIYVPFAMVLPYIISFYFVLGVLEDFGYLPRLAVLADNFMHNLGLHGYSIIPMILGLGCNVPGALAIRILEGRREKFIAATLMAVAVPCMAQIAMIVGLVGQRGGIWLVIVFMTLFLIFIIKGLLLNKFLKGASPEIFIEIPPYRRPHITVVVKKLFMRTLGFLKEAVPYVLLGVFIVNILNTMKVFDSIAGLFAPVLTGMWGLPKEATSALVVGFLRKDVAVGMLGPLNLTNKQLVIGSTILAVYFPCMATFVVLVKELGIKDMLKSAGIMLLTALVIGGLLNIIL